MNDKAESIKLCCKIAITSIIFYLLFTHVNLQQISDLLKHIHPLFLLVAIILHLAAFLCGSVRWWLLLRHIEPGRTYWSIAPAYYLGLFANNFLPTGFGGDAVRATYLSARGQSLSKLVSSTIVDRALGLITLLLTGLLAILLQNIFPLGSKNILLLAGAALVILIGGWLLFSPGTLDLAHTWQKNSNRFFIQVIINTLKLFHAYRHTPKLLLVGMLLSILVQILVIGVYTVLGKGLGLELPTAAYFIIVPLVMLATNVPLSLGGLGLREGALVVLMSGAGVDYEKAVIISLLYLLVLWTSTLPGGLAFLKIHTPLRTEKTYDIAAINTHSIKAS